MTDQRESQHLHDKSKQSDTEQRESVGKNDSSKRPLVSELMRRRDNQSNRNAAGTKSDSSAFTDKTDDTITIPADSAAIATPTDDGASNWRQFLTYQIRNFRSFIKQLLANFAALLTDMAIVPFLHLKSLFRLRPSRLWSNHHAADTAKYYDIFAGRIRIHGTKKFVVEFISEGLTISIVALLVLVSLARSAILETQKQDWLTSDNLSITFLDRNGLTLGKRGDLARKFLTTEQIPQHMVNATLMTFDESFMEHSGFNSIRAMFQDSSPSNELTITQEVAQELFPYDRISHPTLFTNLFLVLWLEISHTKTEILNYYFDRAYFGAGNYGIVAAADYYFNKEADKLSLSEAAMLVGILDSEGSFDLEFSLPYARQKANEVLNRMHNNQLISMEQLEYAQLHPAEVANRPGSSYVPDYFLDIAYQEVKEHTAESTENTFVVRTALDLEVQKMAASAIWQSTVETGQKTDPPQLAIVSMEPDGALLAMVGGPQYGVNRTNPLTKTLRRPGSAIKPLLLASTIDVPELQRTNNGRKLVEYAEWLTNDEPQGNTLLDSDNWDTVETLDKIEISAAEDIDVASLQSSLFSLGVLTDRLSSAETHHLSARATIADLASGYAMLSNSGYRILPYAVLEIADSSGNVVWNRQDYDSEQFRVVKQDTVNLLNQLLVENLQQDPEQNWQLSDFTLAGKFSYSTRANSSWFIGYSGGLTTAVWCGGTVAEPQAKADFVTGLWSNVMRQSLPIVPPLQLAGTDPTLYEMTKVSDAVADRRIPTATNDRSLTGLSPELLTILQEINRELFDIQHGAYN